MLRIVDLRPLTRSIELSWLWSRRLIAMKSIKKAGLNASFSNGLNRLIQAEPTPVYAPKKNKPTTKNTAMPPAVATSQSGKTPSVHRERQATAGRPSGKRSGIRPSG